MIEDIKLHLMGKWVSLGTSIQRGARGATPLTKLASSKGTLLHMNELRGKKAGLSHLCLSRYVDHELKRAPVQLEPIFQK